MAETIRAAVLTGYADLARSVGVDPLRALDRVGIPRAALDSPDLHISAVAMRDLLEFCSEYASDFGLRLMERRPVSVMGPLALVVREQPTLRDAIAAIQRFNDLHHQATHLHIEEVDDLVIARVSVHYETPGPSRQAAEASVAQVVRLLRLCLGPDWRPLNASFTHSRPPTVDAHHRIFGSHIFFDQDFHGVTFRRAALDATNEAADPEMARQITQYVEALSMPSAADIVGRVRGLVMDLLPTGYCTIKVVARQMEVEPRTLQRQLAASGEVTFHDLLQEARLSLAGMYIEESEKPLTEVANLLGFSAMSAFSRWHQDHCGQSASARRTLHRSDRRT